VLILTCKPKNEPAELLQRINESEIQEELWQALAPRKIFCDRATFPSCKEFNMTTMLPETTEDDEIDKTMGAP